ncbi:glycerol-3-phosphate dehydrogenase/oxidase [Sedimentitalea sp.]|uniref:glycerol-3-phosphate dehydrogenase/oxidase n=1 Tax=Sedimentitalea sp. TaxID=2048915 RepID=UPI003296CD4D
MPSQRQASFDALSRDAGFDVLVLGAGINGIGVYRDLALQGLRVLLVERNDFCSGCSSAPSRMIHGGLRYLENGEFNLVRESLAERDALLRNAPHFVRPLPTTIPITSVFSGTLNAAASFLGRSGKPSRRGALPIKLGLALYDWVTRKDRLLPRHSIQSAAATHRARPSLTNELICSATYYDAWISHPERLGLELILDTARDNATCVALNYSELSASGNEFTVTNRQDGRTYPVKSTVLVNATGAWLDEAINLLRPAQNPPAPLVSGTKGSHLILDHPALMQALKGHMVYFENDDGRVCIVFPYLGKVLAGSTDIRVDRATRVRCEPEESDYILDSLRRVFPDIAITSEQIVFSYSGIRPLPKSDHDFTGRISRGHDVRRIDGPVPQFCMIGGKWTTFRAFAEQTADAVLHELDHRRRASTRNIAIGGGEGFARVGPALRDGLEPDRTAHLYATYGSRAKDVLAFCDNIPDDHRLDDACPLTRGEIAFLATQEHVTSLSDIVLRRTTLAVTGQLSQNLIASIADALAQIKDWSDEETDRQINATCDELRDFHGVSAQMLKSRNTKRKI